MADAYQGERRAAVRVDLHAHTNHSIDAWTSPRELVARAAAAGLDRIAVTDHGTISGALAARDIDPERVIVGEEVHSDQDLHLIGLFLEQGIPNGLPLEEIAERIRDQGGVVYAPHPYAYLLDPRGIAARLLGLADVVEAFNSRAFWPPWNRRAAQVARARGLAVAAGSDAHFPREIGRAYALMPAFSTAAEFRTAVRHADPVGGRVGSPWLHVGSMLLDGCRRLGGRRAAGQPRQPASREPAGTMAR